MKKGFILLAALIYLALTTDVQAQFSAETNSIKRSIETYLTKAKKNGFSGSILVDYHDQILLAEGYGYANKAGKIENTTKTVFSTGSVTKQFTGAAILKLEMQGKLSVTDKITKYFDAVPDHRSHFTIHDLLTHSAGFPSAIGDDYDEISENDFVKDAFESKLRFPDSSKYNYSNVGYSLLAIIVEKVSGMSYEAYLSKNLFVPAGMFFTGYVLPQWDTLQLAVGYRGVDISWGRPNEKNWSEDGPYLNLKGNGGILSTVEDLYLWHKALKSNAILDIDAKEKYYMKHVEEGEGSGSYYGYGWAIFPTARNTELIAHNGGNGVFFTDFWRYLDEEVTIILMTNNTKPESDRMASDIARIIRNPDQDIDQLFTTTAPQLPVAELEAFAMEVYSTLVNGGEAEWKVFLMELCSEDFRSLAPLEKHFSIIKNFKAEFKDSLVDDVSVQGNEVFLTLNSDGIQSLFIISIELNKGEEMIVASLRND